VNNQIINPVKPRYLEGLATLFWGFQSELLWFAIPMAIMLEARYHLNRRWALLKSDFYRVADLTSFGLVAMVLFLFLNRQDYHFITTLIMWLPILLFPLVVVLAYSTTPRMSLDVLFYSLRRQREPVQQSWDMDYVFMGSCLLAAGLNREGAYFFPIVAMFVIAALYQLRSPRFSKTVFLLSMSIVFLSASALHYGIRGAHLGIKAKTGEWIADWISQRTDPLKTSTAIGQLGRLKLSDAIYFRIEPTSGRPDFPPLMREATYNYPSTTNWEVFDPRFPPVEEVDDFRWEFAEQPGFVYPEAFVHLEFDRDNALVPVPPDLSEINELSATLGLRMSAYGSIQGTGLVPAPYYRVRYDGEKRLGEPPTSTDLAIPPQYLPALQEIMPKNATAAEGLRYVQQYFADFRYTLYQQEDEIAENPLVHFLTRSKAGHCEYFASATALMLRQAGIPARYVVGFSIQEWNEDMSMYIVRRRHAHAWATAYIDDQWIVVDTTPSQWLTMEESQAGLFQPLWDFLGNNQFRLQRWWSEQKLEDYERELYGIGFILVLILIWRISTSEQVIIGEEDRSVTEHREIPGSESPFFEVEAILTEQGFRRGRGELMANWLLRIERPELLPLLISHNRWRFDPRGITKQERQRLDSQVKDWLQTNTAVEG
jgi:transglutaminase-like putative cysteine protease